MVSSTDHDVSRKVVFSIPLSPRPSEAQTPSSSPYSQTPSAYFPPSMSVTKFYTRNI